MDNYSTNGINAQLAEYETPFADVSFAKEEPQNEEFSNFDIPAYQELESPFAQTFETQGGSVNLTPFAQDYVSFLGELHDSEFANVLDELAAELEDTWSGKISNEVAMGEKFVPYVTQHANEYFAPFIATTESMIDKVSEHFSGNNLADYSESEIDQFFSDMEYRGLRFSPAQEQLFGSVWNKVKSVVKKGVDIVKKGVNVVGKILPLNIILNKLKGLIRPLLNKVLKFAIGKLPKNLQPYAQTLSRKFLNLETPAETEEEENEVDANGNLEAVQTEFDNHIANLVFSEDETEAEDLVMSYETSSDSLQRETDYETGGLNLPNLEAGRQQFIDDLKNLKEGESPAPAIERFLPIAIMALKPAIKVALSIVGRQKVINFLAGLLAKLVGSYVPENVAKPLAASIIDVGMKAIGFETYEGNKTDVAYEAIANTIQETVQNLGSLNEEMLNDNDALTGELLEAFETAAANNFPTQYIKEAARKSTQPGLWVLKPRNGPRYYYKKYTHVFNTTVTPQIAQMLKTFKGAPLSNFLRDKLGLDPTKPIQARVHLYQAINGTRLRQICRYENVPGLGPSQPHGSVQFHPFTVEAASLLCKEPGLGKNYSSKFTSKRHRTAIGQRFYYLEINGARLRVAPIAGIRRSEPDTIHSANVPMLARVAGGSDVQAVINFVRSEIKFNYYFSEEEAKAVVEKLNRNDFLGASMNIRQSVKNVLNDMLRSNIGNKVKIIHEAVPEMFLEYYPVQQEQFSFGDVSKAIGKISLNAGKELLIKMIEKLINKLSILANDALANYFKSRSNEFKNAQAGPQDGVTVQIVWLNIQGMGAVKSVINAIRGNISIPNLADLSLPNITAPEVRVTAGKKFE